MNYYVSVLKKYAEFNGRAQRAEYWYFALFHTIILITLMYIDSLTGLDLLYFIYFLATFIPAIAVAVRRLHDIGKSGWWILITFIPLIGSIWFLILMVIDSNPEENKFGPNPKQVPVATNTPT